MNTLFALPFLFFALFFLTACEPKKEVNSEAIDSSQLSQQELNIEAPEASIADSSSEFKEIDWDALIPEADLQALMTPPDYINEIEDGSLEDNFEKQIADAFDKPDDAYSRALVSTNVIAAMDGARVKIPGFIVPIETNEDKLVTEFFIVPYFGACLHMPPPPPNQIIYAFYPQGVEQPNLYEPFWLSGELKTEVKTNDLAQAAYVMRVASYELYNQY